MNDEPHLEALLDSLPDRQREQAEDAFAKILMCAVMAAEDEAFPRTFIVGDEVAS